LICSRRQFQNGQDKTSRLAQQHITVFSLAPLLIIVIAIARFGIWRRSGKGRNWQDNSRLSGKDGAEVIETAIENANKPDTEVARLSVS